jgi:hypothetical protein
VNNRNSNFSKFKHRTPKKARRDYPSGGKENRNLRNP